MASTKILKIFENPDFPNVLEPTEPMVFLGIFHKIKTEMKLSTYSLGGKLKLNILRPKGIGYHYCLIDENISCVRGLHKSLI